MNGQHRDKLIDELFEELDRMSEDDLLKDLRSTSSGPLRIAMNPQYVSEQTRVCKKQCIYDGRLGICKGCGRTLEEIERAGKTDSR